MVFVPFDILTAAELNQMVANDQALAAGTGLNSNAITGVKVANSTVEDRSLINGKIYRRRGGNATNWQTTGTTNYDVSATNTRIQVGAVTSSDNTTNGNNGSFSTSAQTVTFPVAYTNPPLVMVSPQGDHAFATVTGTTTTAFTWRGRSPANINANVSISWIAVGE